MQIRNSPSGVVVEVPSLDDPRFFNDRVSSGLRTSTGVLSLPPNAPLPGQVLTSTSGGLVWAYPSNAHVPTLATLWDCDPSRPAFCEYRFATTNTTVTIGINAQLPGLDDQREVAVFVNGVPTVYNVPEGFSTIDLTLAAGVKNIIIREGPKAYAYIGAEVAYVLASDFTLAVPAAPSRRLVYVADSIGCGFLCTSPTTQAYSQIVKSAGIYDVTCHSDFGSAAVYGLMGTPADRQALLDSLVFDGTLDNVMYVALGYNDYYHHIDIATWTADYSAFLDLAHAAYPSLVIYCQSPIHATIESGVPALADYGTALAGICSIRPYAIYVNGFTQIVAALSPDGIHPTTAGNVTYAADESIILGVTMLQDLATATHSAWWSPDRGHTVAAGKLTAWNDSTGHGFNATDNTAKNPNVGALVNGTPAAVCDGTKTMLLSGTNDTSTTHTWVIALNEHSNAAGAYQTFARGAAVGQVAPEPNVSGVVGVEVRGVTDVAVTGAAATTGEQVLGFLLNGTTYTVYRNGVLIGTIAAQPAGEWHPAYFLGNNGAGGCVNADVAEAVYCNSTNLALIASATAHMRSRCGI